MLQVKDRQGSTSLHIAATHGHFEMCQVLLGQGADCNIEDDNEWLALHCAAKGGYLDVVSFLVQSGSSTKHESCEHKIPLWWGLSAIAGNNMNFFLQYFSQYSEKTPSKTFLHSTFYLHYKIQMGLLRILSLNL